LAPSAKGCYDANNGLLPGRELEPIYQAHACHAACETTLDRLSWGWSGSLTHRVARRPRVAGLVNAALNRVARPCAKIKL